LGLFFGIAGLASAVAFPGTVREAPDPTRRYAVVWSEATDDKPHRLSLVDKKSNIQRPLATFPRHVSVLWSPDSTALSVTDWEGSDYSSIQVYFVEATKDSVSIPAALKKAKGILPQIAQNHHVYFEAIEWRDRSTLLFQVRGYGDHDPSGFTRRFEYGPAGKFRPVEGSAGE